MRRVDITENTGCYASKWGLSDFYEEAEKSLRDVLASGEDFDTGWFGCKKEIDYAQIVRDGGKIMISVACHMDDLWEQDDLIYDALWEVSKIEKEFPKEIIDSIREAACDEQLDDHTTVSESMPADSSFEDIVSMLDKLEGIADCGNKEMYKSLCEIVCSHLEYMKENEIGFVCEEE